MDRVKNDIPPSSSNSTIRKSILSRNERIVRCAVVGPRNTIQWRADGEIPSTQNIVSTIRRMDNRVSYARGIWATTIPRMVAVIWRLRWDNLHTFDRIRSWGLPVLDSCVLCD